MAKDKELDRLLGVCEYTYEQLDDWAHGTCTVDCDNVNGEPCKVRKLCEEEGTKGEDQLAEYGIRMLKEYYGKESP